jgi:hypothetical protein
MDEKEKKLVTAFIKAFLDGIDKKYHSKFGGVQVHCSGLIKFFNENFSPKVLLDHNYDTERLCIFFIKRYPEILSKYGITVEKIPEGLDVVLYKGEFCEFYLD